MKTGMMISGYSCKLLCHAGWITTEAMSDGQQLCFDTKDIYDWLVITFINVAQKSAACNNCSMAHTLKWHTDTYSCCYWLLIKYFHLDQNLAV